MGHDWVIEVLQDLADYAERNGLPLLARKAIEAFRAAREEIEASALDESTGGEGGTPPLH